MQCPGPAAAVSAALAGGAALAVLWHLGRGGIEWARDHPRSNVYNLKDVASPHLVGVWVKALAVAAKIPALGFVIKRTLLKAQGFERVRVLAAQLDDEDPLLHPIPHPSTERADGADGSVAGFSTSYEALCSLLPAPASPSAAGFRHWTAGQLTDAYESGKTTPVEVLGAVVRAIEASNTGPLSLKAVSQMDKEDVAQQAQASARRWAAQKPLSPLDGVPIAVKEMVDVKGYVNHHGIGLMEAVNGVCERDCVCIARLKAAGAVIVGMTGMHEIGLGVTGFNRQMGAFRNPHNTSHYAGGSSSGSGSAVAAGLVPIAVAVDGGGSIRVPASFNGVVGLKPSYKRVPGRQGHSVSGTGPIAGCARDSALAYCIMAGGDAGDPLSLSLPSPRIGGFGGMGLGRLKVGVYQPYFEHADKSVVDACARMVEGLCAKGGQVSDVVVNCLEEMRLAHLIIISGEINADYDSHYTQDSSQFLPDNEALLGITRQLSSLDLFAAMKVRAWALRELERVFQDVDVIALPTTGMTAPAISKGCGRFGETNARQGSVIMRFAFPANFVGLPTITIPAGVDSLGLPIGFQLIAWHWREHLLLRVANELEAAGLSEQARPQAYFGDEIRGILNA